MTPERCEPPPELRDVDGWHWVKCGDDDPEVVRWQHDGGGIWCMGTGSPRPAYAYSLGWRYLAPVSTPAEVDALRADLERERMRLAACGVVALSDTPESAARERNMHPDYRSASCDDVARRVDECMSSAPAWRRWKRRCGMRDCNWNTWMNAARPARRQQF